MRNFYLLLFVALTAGLGTYLSLGSPSLLFSPPPQQTGPSADRVAALQSQLAGAGEDQVQATIQGMVAGLRNRLESEGGTVEEWDRLVRSYANLQDLDGIRFALDGLLGVSPDDPQALLLAGQAAAQAGERTQAKAYFERLLPLIDPEHPRFEQIKALIEGFDAEPVEASEN